MAQANARGTVGSLFATVGTVANTATSLVNVVGDGIQYVDNYVKSVLDEQEVRLAVDKVDFERRVAEEKAVEMAERASSIQEFLGKGQNKHYFDAAMTEIQTALAARKQAPVTK